MIDDSIEVRWRAGSRMRGDARKIADELERVRDAHGKLDAALVVEAARNAASPLHDLFEWDDSEAARLYREEQARLVMRSIMVVREDVQVGPLFISVAVEREDLRDYVQAPTLTTMDVQRLAALDDCRRALRGLEKRYRYLGELDEIWIAIDQAIGSS